MASKIYKSKYCLIFLILATIIITACSAKDDKSGKSEVNEDDLVALFSSQDLKTDEKSDSNIVLSDEAKEYLLGYPGKSDCKIKDFRIDDSYRDGDKFSYLISYSYDDPKPPTNQEIFRLLLVKEEDKWKLEKILAPDMLYAASYKNSLPREDRISILKEYMQANKIDGSPEDYLEKQMAEIDQAYDFYSTISMFEENKDENLEKDIIKVMEAHSYK